MSWVFGLLIHCSSKSIKHAIQIMAFQQVWMHTFRVTLMYTCQPVSFYPPTCSSQVQCLQGRWKEASWISKEAMEGSPDIFAGNGHVMPQNGQWDRHLWIKTGSSTFVFFSRYCCFQGVQEKRQRLYRGMPISFGTTDFTKLQKLNISIQVSILCTIIGPQTLPFCPRFPLNTLSYFWLQYIQS